MDISGLFKNLVSITQFNKGQASPLFSRAQRGETLLVIKNNTPVAVILSPEEYEILRTFPKMYNKMLETSYADCSEEINALMGKLNVYDKGGDLHV